MCIDDDALAARLAAQVLIVDELETVLADDVVGRITLVLAAIVFLLGDLPDVSECCRTGSAERIIANGLHF